MTCWRPFPSVKLRTVRVFSLTTNILERQFLSDHVSMGARLFLVSDVEERLIKLLLRRTKREAEVFVSSSSGQKKGLEHGKCQVVVILTCRREFTCVLAIISGEGFKVFAGVLRRVAGLDRGL